MIEQTLTAHAKKETQITYYFLRVSIDMWTDVDETKKYYKLWPETN
jgi:hypothetical protein